MSASCPSNLYKYTIQNVTYNWYGPYIFFATVLEEREILVLFWKNEIEYMKAGRGIDFGSILGIFGQNIQVQQRILHN